MLLLIISNVLFGQSYLLEKRDSIKKRMDKNHHNQIAANSGKESDFMLSYKNKAYEVFYAYYFNKDTVCYKVVYGTTSLQTAGYLEDDLDLNYIKKSEYNWESENGRILAVKRNDGYAISFVYLLSEHKEKAID